MMTKKLMLSFLLSAALGAAAQEDRLVPPEEFLGHRVGEDFRLADYTRVVEYMEILDEASNRIEVQELGRSTLDNSFIMVIISSEENILNLEKHKEVMRRLADPRQLTEEEAGRLVETAKMVVMVGVNIHSTEIAANQMSMELAYLLAAAETPLRREILDNVILLLVPSVNPDGQRIVVNWYNRTLGTPYEGSRPPWLYHHYAGHDDNRDWHFFNLKETRLVSRQLYHEWFPPIVVDEHQMGSYGPRLFIPPYMDPLDPNLDPLLVRGTMLIGGAMTTRLEQAGYAGVITNAMYDHWFPGYFNSAPKGHNMITVLTEAASARLASPVFVTASELQAPRRSVQSGYGKGETFPNPWPGGWWRLRDIVDYELVMTEAVLELAAKYRSVFLENFYLMGRRNVEKGESEPPYAFIFPAAQRDPGATAQLLGNLHFAGVELHRAVTAFTADGVSYPAGTHVVLMAQPFRPFAKSLLEIQDYPERRVYTGGPPERPYDVTAWSLPLQMGARGLAAVRPFEAELEEIDEVVVPPGSVTGNGPYLICSHAPVASAKAANRILREGGRVYWLEDTGELAVASGSVRRSLLEELAREEGLSFRGAPARGAAYGLTAPRVALYKPWTGSADEGWTRLVLERYEFGYENVADADIKAGALANYDVLILPDESAESLERGRALGTVPPEYAGGLGEQGLTEIRKWVEAGGTLVALDSSSDLAIELLDLPVRNVLSDVPDDEFLCPGSLLRIEVDTDQPLAFGLPEESIAFFLRSPAFTIRPGDGGNGATAVATYPRSGVLAAGWINGENELHGRSAIVEATSGDGRAILIGFRAQHRAQSVGTFHFLFNALFYSAAEATTLP
jgi:hypothetical protein